MHSSTTILQKFNQDNLLIDIFRLRTCGSFRNPLNRTNLPPDAVGFFSSQRSFWFRRIPCFQSATSWKKWPIFWSLSTFFDVFFYNRKLLFEHRKNDLKYCVLKKRVDDFLKQILLFLSGLPAYHFGRWSARKRKALSSIKLRLEEMNGRGLIKDVLALPNNTVKFRL